MSGLSNALNVATKVDNIILKVKEKLISQWKWIQRPIHIVAHILHPL